MSSVINPFAHNSEETARALTTSTIASVGVQVREQVQARQAFVRESFSWEGPDPVETLSPWNG